MPYQLLKATLLALLLAVLTNMISTQIPAQADDQLVVGWFAAAVRVTVALVILVSSIGCAHMAPAPAAAAAETIAAMKSSCSWSYCT